MNLKNLLTSLLVIAFFTLAVNSATFAATWYVSNTNGNDVTGDGQPVGTGIPYKTIGKALIVAANGDIIRIDADTYTEATVNVTKQVTFVAQTFNALNVVTIQNGIIINPGAGNNVNLGRSADASQLFNLGTGNALTLTSGNLIITGSNVVIGDGGNIIRTAGTISETPVTSNVDVTYNGTASLDAGPELPASLGTGSLDVAIAGAAAVLTVTNPLTISTGDLTLSGTGSATFNGAVTVSVSGTQVASVSAIENSSTGTLTFASPVTFSRSAGTLTTDIVNSADGKININGGIVRTGTTTVGINNSSTGEVTIAASSSSFNAAVANTNAGGTIELTGNVTFEGALNNVGTVKLNSNQLTLAGGAFTATGNIISATASTVGNGQVNIAGAVTKTGAGELPNVIISSGGSLILAAAPVVHPVYGTLTVSSAVAGALTFNDNTIEIYGSSFSRTDNTPANVAQGTGTLTFRGGLAQAFTPGASLTLYNLELNKTASTVVALGAALNISNNLTITSGTLDVGNFNLNMTGAGIFTNSGQAYSSTGMGYVNFEGTTGTVTGTGTFGNILVNLSVAGNAVNTGSGINFSGILYINQGDFNVAAGHTMTFSNTIVANPTVKINTTTANSAALTSAGTVTYTPNVNLEYFGANNYTAGVEWTAAPTKLNNVSILVDDNTAATTLTVTGGVGASTINGKLNVIAEAALAQGAVYTLAGNSQAHTVYGTVSGNTLTVTGNSSSISGNSATTAASTINNLIINVGAANTFVSTGLKNIGDVTNTTGTSTITMDATTSVVGDVTVAAGSLTLVDNGTTSSLTGNVAVAASSTLDLTVGGALTGNIDNSGTTLLTFPRATKTVSGTVDLTDGTLTLGSNVTVSGVTTQVAGNLALGGFTYAQSGTNYTRTGAGTVTNGTVAFNATTGNIIVTPGATFVLPNVVINGTANGVTFNASLEIAGTLALSGAGTISQSAGVLTLSGSAVTVASGTGAFTGAVALTSAAQTITLSTDYTIPTVTLNSDGTVTLASNNTTARTLTVSGLFTQTKGVLALGINNLNLTLVGAAYTRAAGSITATTGAVIFAGAGAQTFTPGTGLSIDNLTIATTAGGTVTNSTPTVGFAVAKKLTLSGAGALVTNAGTLGIANGATIERTLTTSILSTIPTFGTGINVVYSGAEAANITTANELPATVNDLTINRSTNPTDIVLLNKNLTVNGTLYLTDGVLDESTFALTLGAAATLNKTAAGSFEGTDAPTVTTYNLVYSGAAAITTTASDFMTGLLSLSVQTTGGAVVSLHAGQTINGDVTVNAAGAGGGLDLNSKTLNVTGDVTVTAGTIQNTNAVGTAQLAFTGTEAQTLTVPAAGLTFPATAVNATELVLNNTSDAGVTLAGGNLTLTRTGKASIIRFIDGVLHTGDNIVTLWHDENTIAPLQGFDRTGVTGTNESHIMGNVKKFIDATGSTGLNEAIALTRIEFPVGTDAEYRPFALQFNTLPSAGFNLTVSHDTVSAEGENGFPISATDALGNPMSITNYPDFYWLVKSDLTLQPAVQFDVEASAAGYTDYQTDGIQNIRFIRRFSNNKNNPWVLQGGTSYDNSTDGTTPVVIVRNATGAISTQGALFTYSQNNKAPNFTAALTNQTVNEGDTLSFTYTAVDPDISQTATLSSVTLPAGATFNAQTGAFNWIIGYTQAGTHTITIRATDGVESRDTSAVITVSNVNFGPQFTAEIGTDTIAHTETLSFDYNATDVDGQPVTFALVSVVPALAGTASIVPATGVFTFDPEFADAGKTFVVTVSATDGVDTVENADTIVVVNGALRGDADANGVIGTNDAVTILRGILNDTTFTTAVDTFRADASQNGVISAFDAYYVLYYVTHSSFPTLAKLAPAIGEVKFGELRSSEAENIVSLPVRISNTSGVNSAFVELTIDEQYAEYKGVSVNAEGWLSQSSYANGTLRIALVGTSELKDGDVAVVNLSLKNKEAKFEVNGNVTLNEDIAKTLAGSTVKLIPSQFALSQNYPNPFNPTTNMKYQLAADTKVSLVVYDMLGQKVASVVDGVQEAGYYTVQWNGTNDFGQRVSSGVYLYRLIAGDFVKTMKMNLLK
jgi:hypothetical protein